MQSRLIGRGLKAHYRIMAARFDRIGIQTQFARSQVFQSGIIWILVAMDAAFQSPNVILIPHGPLLSDPGPHKGCRDLDDADPDERAIPEHRLYDAICRIDGEDRHPLLVKDVFGISVKRSQRGDP